jgi:hypothetical protein
VLGGVRIDAHATHGVVRGTPRGCGMSIALMAVVLGAHHCLQTPWGYFA